MLSNKIKYLREIWHRDIMSMRSVMRSFFSYIQNEMLLKQNIEWDEFEDYNYFRNIHYFLKLYNVENMEANICRVGGGNWGWWIYHGKTIFRKSYCIFSRNRRKRIMGQADGGTRISNISI